MMETLRAVLRKNEIEFGESGDTICVSASLPGHVQNDLLLLGAELRRNGRFTYVIGKEDPRERT